MPGGLSSGEGIIWAVRDPIISRDKKTGEEVEKDAGIADKRLLVVEAEFANVLRQFERTGNTLSATLRSLWDRGNVRSLTKNSPAKTTGAHVGVIGHVTQDELTRYLDRTEMANGFANRLLFGCVKRSQQLPFGGTLTGTSLDRLVESVHARLQDVARAGERHVRFTPAARVLWGAEYGGLTADRPGIYGAVTARAEAQVLRLSLIYALLDEAVLAAGEIIDVPHLKAALAVWKMCDASASNIFGRALGDPVADEIYRVLRQSPLGLTRSDIINHFGRNRGAQAIGRALALLLQHGLARFETNPTGGRAEERWYAV